MDLEEAVFGAPPLPFRRLVTLIQYLPGDSALYAVTHDADGEPTHEAARPTTHVVTSLRGVNLAALYASTESVN